MSIEDLLDQMSALGRPRLSKMDDGTWHANLTLPAPEGVTAKVASDFDHKTHREALETVLDRFQALRRTVSVDTVVAPALSGSR